MDGLLCDHDEHQRHQHQADARDEPGPIVNCAHSVDSAAPDGRLVALDVG